MPYVDEVGNTNLMTNVSSSSLDLNLKPRVAYRITAIAYGRKSGTMAVLQQTYSRTRKRLISRLNFQNFFGHLNLQNTRTRDALETEHIMMKKQQPSKTLLASMIRYGTQQTFVLALDFAQSPPGTIEPYIANHHLAR